MLSHEAVEQFKRLYKEEYGEDIPTEQAVELGINLLTFFKHVYRPVKTQWLAEVPANHSQQGKQ